jgi:hypothetical protein
MKKKTSELIIGDIIKLNTGRWARVATPAPDLTVEIDLGKAGYGYHVSMRCNAERAWELKTDDVFGEER